MAGAESAEVTVTTLDDKINATQSEEELKALLDQEGLLHTDG